MYRYISRESCSQFDSLPLTSLTISPLRSPPCRSLSRYSSTPSRPPRRGRTALSATRRWRRRTASSARSRAPRRRRRTAKSIAPCGSSPARVGAPRTRERRDRTARSRCSKRPRARCGSAPTRSPPVRSTMSPALAADSTSRFVRSIFCLFCFSNCFVCKLFCCSLLFSVSSQGDSDFHRRRV